MALNRRKLIGCVSSDSGSIAVVDPCHLSVSESGEVCLPAWNLHTSFTTGLGDGEFTVYEQRDQRGKLKRVVIEID